MESKVVIELPKGLLDGDIELFLREHKEDLYPAMDLEVQDLDDRATLDDVEIDRVEVDEDTVLVEYTVEFSAYHGCRDMNYADTDDRAISGVREGDKLVFDVFVPPEKRSTYEEY